ncbi:MAG: sodium:proton antiporter [Bacteroidetes bacterium HGW-Bacteroidetes-10]|nr:MAG: sodium:proton antiporter [Bacteroidetes bacterium HGW-Bacteroidetes-10]
MTATIIITFCALLLVAYIFDLTSTKTKVPSVILLLVLGWLLQELTTFLGIKVPDFTTTLPVLGSVGLILIVLDGSMELDFNKSKLKLISKSFLGSLFSIFAIAFAIAWLFYMIDDQSFNSALVNAIPISIISSAIAIPSSRNMSRRHREFIVYDTSFSDIVGVIFFTFVAMSTKYTLGAFVDFGLELLLMVVISTIATVGLSFLLSKLDHHIKFIPIILLVILIYSIAEFYHLPALIFILLFGISIGNLDKLKRISILNSLDTGSLDKEVTRFREITSEATFLIRSLFFLMFGFLVETSEILNADSLQWAFCIVGVILIIRALQLKLTGQKIFPLVFIAPRGLITILLFLTISPLDKIGFVNQNLILQIVVITTLIMMIGTLSPNKEQELKKNI